VIQEKLERDANKQIKSFTEDKNLQLLNGRYGPYISYNKANYKIPKGMIPAELSFEQVMKIIKDAPEKPVKMKTKAKSASKTPTQMKKAKPKRKSTRQSRSNN